MPRAIFKRTTRNYARARRGFKRRRTASRRRWFRRPLVVRAARTAAKALAIARRTVVPSHRLLLNNSASGGEWAAAAVVTRWDSPTTIQANIVQQGDGTNNRTGSSIRMRWLHMAFQFLWHCDTHANLVTDWVANGGAAQGALTGESGMQRRRMRLMLIWQPEFVGNGSAVLNVGDILEGMPGTPANFQIEPFANPYRGKLPISGDSLIREKHFRVLYDKVITFHKSVNGDLCYDRYNANLKLPLFMNSDYTNTTTGRRQALYFLIYRDRTDITSSPVDSISMRYKGALYFDPL